MGFYMINRFFIVYKRNKTLHFSSVLGILLVRITNVWPKEAYFKQHEYHKLHFSILAQSKNIITNCFYRKLFSLKCSLFRVQLLLSNRQLLKKKTTFRLPSPFHGLLKHFCPNMFWHLLRQQCLDQLKVQSKVCLKWETQQAPVWRREG